MAGLSCKILDKQEKIAQLIKPVLILSIGRLRMKD